MYWNELYKIDDASGKQIIDIEKVEISWNFIKTLMWEILTCDELRDFLELSNKIDPDIISVYDRFYRLKRNNKNWVQHKDTTYIRWLLKAIEEINKFIISDGKEWIAPEDLFIGKISFEETKSLKKIKEKKGIETIKPLFISDAVFFIVSERLKNWEKSKINWEKFYKYLQEKYPIFNFSLEQIYQVTKHTKENVAWLVNLLFRCIWGHQIKQIAWVNKSLLWIIDKQYNPKIKRVKNKLNESRREAK